MKWTLMVKIDEKEALKSVEFIRKGIMVSASVVAVFGIILFSMYVRFVVSPIKKMSSAAGQIAAGNYNVFIPVKSTDEVGTLSASFNNMVREIRNRTAELIKLSMVIENSVNVVFIADAGGDIEYVNPMFEKITGWSKDESIGRNFSILVSEEDIKGKYRKLLDTITAGRTWRGMCENKKKDGGSFWANCIMSPIKDENGNITNFLAVQEDITEKKEAEERARYLYSYDDLTGLLTRQRFIEEVDAWIEHHNSPEDTGALLLIDIDDFKSLNDTYSHLIGDEFLHHVAGMLKETIENKKREIFLSRLGEDEFSIFIPACSETECMYMAERVRKEIAGINFEPMSAHFTASIGSAVYPEHGTTVSELFTKVDTALRRAKETGRNRCHLYSEDDRDIEHMHSRLNEKIKIQSAMAEDRFEPWFQPILDLKDNKIYHYEALARMRDEKRGLVLSVI
ncbi:MAG: diguanylate cyclase [Deltaproteobacteria bacterium]|nr:diguanylate cyclase [Deltaproteobacteria bacterium]